MKLKESISKHILIFLYVIFLLTSKMLFANDTTIISKKWYIPDCATIQYAGNIGFLSTGLGYFIGCKEKYQIRLIYGYTPEFEGSKDIHTIAIKNEFVFLNKSINKNYAISSTIGITPLFSGYFPMHLITHLGGKIHRNLNGILLSGLNAYFEIGTTAMYIEYLLKSPKGVKVTNIVYLALGIDMIF